MTLEYFDKVLDKIKRAKASLEKVEKEAEAEIEKVKARYDGKIAALQEQIEALSLELINGCKENKERLFGDSDIVELKNGVLIYSKEYRVRRARGVLKKLEELGFDEAIKISKSVRWDVIESWPDDRLSMVGTERRLKENFSFEIR